MQLSGDEGPMEDVPLDEEKKSGGAEEETFDLITDEEVVQSMHVSMIEPSLHDPKYEHLHLSKVLVKHSLNLYLSPL